MSVKLDNFVDVKIVKRAAAPSPAVFDTAVFVSSEESGAPYNCYVTITGGTGGPTNRGTKANPYSLTDTFAGTSTFGSDSFIKCFFDNGGKYLHVISGLAYNSTDKLWYINTTTTELPQNEIVIFSDSTLTPTIVEGPDQKIFLCSITATTIPAGTSGSGIVYNYRPANVEYNGFGIAAIAAYYTKINISNSSTIKDYAFTAQKELHAGAIVTNNTDAATCIANHINCTVYLAGANRNIGGDDSTGEDITNLFMRIALQQTLTNRLLNVLVTKLPLNQIGINMIQAAVCAELNIYVNNGYIDTSKIWVEDDLYIDGELVAAQGNSLPGGYAIHIAPITAANYTNHQAPEIYILYGDIVGIRKIVITGEAF